MPCDEDLADRVRALLPADVAGLARPMFGGVAFFVGGNMAVAVSGQGGLLVRVDPEEADVLVATTTAVPMEMRGRPMRGWLRVDAAHLAAEQQLSTWVDRGVACAGSLPSKEPGSGRSAGGSAGRIGREPTAPAAVKVAGVGDHVRRGGRSPSSERWPSAAKS